MVKNGISLYNEKPVFPIIDHKENHMSGTSYGLGEAGYDIRIKQTIRFANGMVQVDDDAPRKGHFTLASSIEQFCMPKNLVAIVHDKSTWARQGLSVFNTVIEPGWKGYLTLELAYHGDTPLVIPSGSGIAQVIFSIIEQPAAYNGKYQNQEDKPIHSIFKKD